MIDIDIDALTIPLSEEEPAGPDLEYDPDFTELERLVAEAEAPDLGDAEREEPNWRAVDEQAHALLERTRDLRVAAITCRSSLHQNGLIGYSRHLSLLRTLVTTLWEQVHPQLDPDDDNDPTMRINVLISLVDPMTSIAPLRAAPLVESRALGRFGMRDIMIANGELNVPEGEEHNPVSVSTIDSAFMDADLETLEATAEAITGAIDEVDAIEEAVTEYVGAGDAVSLEELRTLLRSMRNAMDARLTLRRGDDAPEEAEMEGGAAPSGRAGAPGSGQIDSRQDVLVAIDRIVAYYQSSEPGSPVPILMQRAKRLVNMNFMEIIRDIAPDGLPQAEQIRGEADGDGSAVNYDGATGNYTDDEYEDGESESSGDYV